MGPAFNCNMPQLDHHPRSNVGNFSTNNERLHLKWKGLAANLSAEVSDLSFTKSDTDVLLLPSASKGFSLKAHRVVLAAASDFFKSVLLQSPSGEDPVLLLESMDGETLNDLMDYLYRGQVNLTPRRLDRLIAWGKVLAIKGILELEASATSTSSQYVRPTFHHPTSTMDLPMNCAPLSWSTYNAPISNGNWSNSLTSHSTGLSLLASAALDSDHDVIVRERRFSSGNDENNSLNGNNGPSMQAIPPVSAMNLSMKPNSNCDSSDPTSTASGKQSTMPTITSAGLKPVLYPKQNSILNIPNPNSLKWKRALMTSVAAAAASASTSSTTTSGAELMEVVDGSEDEDTLTIDMSANISIQETSTTPVGLPATPSPSPSSIGNGNTSIVDHRLPVIEKGNGNGLSFQLGLLPQSVTENSSSNEELLNHSHVKPRQNSESLSQSSNGEGKKWKSRQPKLCEHCDRYFSNQFNLKQVCINCTYMTFKLHNLSE